MLQDGAPCCNILHHLAPSCNIRNHPASFWTMLHHVAPSCTILPHLATFFTMLHQCIPRVCQSLLEYATDARNRSAYLRRELRAVIDRVDKLKQAAHKSVND